MGLFTATEMVSVAAKPKIDWSLLPTELLIEVLEQYLVISNPIKSKTHRLIMKMRVLPLLLTKNEKITGCVKHVYYGKNTFQMTSEEIVCNWSLPLRIGQHIRHLEIPINSATSYAKYCPVAYEEHCWDADWEASLPHIKTLRVLLTIQYDTDPTYFEHGHGKIDGLGPHLLNQSSLIKCVDALKPKVLALKPKHFTFKVICQGCPFAHFGYMQPCNCNHIGRFEEIVTRQIIDHLKSN